jgi:tryptophan halogenase
MPSGWCWRIDHPERIHRGYVYSSAHLGDDEAERQYREAAPRAGETRIVKFRSGRYRDGWAGNVVAIGNAAGFVEPLEATALMVICLQSRWLADGLIDSLQHPSPTLRSTYNRLNASMWDDIRDFLAAHYAFNDRLDTPFWRQCREESDLGGAADLIAFYKENGPSAIGACLLGRDNPFGIDGYYAILGGLQVPHQSRYEAPSVERSIHANRIRRFREIAANALSMPETARHLARRETWTKIRTNVAR